MFIIITIMINTIKLFYTDVVYILVQKTLVKPSEAALEEIANFDGKVYTIGFMVNDKAESF